MVDVVVSEVPETGGGGDGGGAGGGLALAACGERKLPEQGTERRRH